MNLSYEGKTSVYHFRGERLDPPPPGSYDAAAWTPPTHRLYRVEFQNDNTAHWTIFQNDAAVDYGDWETPSKANARRLVLAYINKYKASGKEAVS